MKHGVPVVVTGVGGNPEVVVDGLTGYLVPPRDPGAFADRVIALLRNPDLRHQMGDAARGRIADKFDIRKTAEAYLDVYRGVLGAGD
jgi:glycosyltransferase involved in cell wall biosynthesis